ncbi:MAG: flagellar basal-body rod protein FlgC [Candidatus Scalindua rubra]|uniref:Flagellar basal-body rod protein FlgC n=1 Tax=Candidatus Scalindua rubra TaxID=1872076 RepID=A0A1E3X441_9BACT|nr:MAG: flagellar basal-body rod protein FlgC [Candidatus Scalindua rubra]
MPVFNETISLLDISASGLTSERIRMGVIANNIANAQVTETSDGGPYKRQQVEFSSVLKKTMMGKSKKDAILSGVEVKGVKETKEPPNMVYMPGHPKADEEGFVKMPNVSIAKEMVDMISASRSYEANTAVISTFRKMNERALSIIRR